MLLQRSKLLYVVDFLHFSPYNESLDLTLELSDSNVSFTLWVLINSSTWLFWEQVRKRPLNKKESVKNEEDIIDTHSNCLTVHETKLKVSLWLFDFRANLNCLSHHSSKTLRVIYDSIIAGWLDSLCWKAWVCVRCRARWRSIKWWGDCYLKVHRINVYLQITSYTIVTLISQVIMPLFVGLSWDGGACCPLNFSAHQSHLLCVWADR